MPSAVVASAKQYAELFSDEGPRKRQRTSFSLEAEVDEEQGGIESEDFEVSDSQLCTWASVSDSEKS